MCSHRVSPNRSRRRSCAGYRRSHCTWLCRVSRPLTQFSGWKLSLVPLPPYRLGSSTFQIVFFPPSLLVIQLEPERYPEMTCSDLAPNSTGDPRLIIVPLSSLWHRLWSSRTAPCSGDASGLCHRFPSAAFQIRCPSLPRHFPSGWHFCLYSRADATERFARCQAWQFSLYRQQRLSLI